MISAGYGKIFFVNIFRAHNMILYVIQKQLLETQKGLVLKRNQMKKQKDF